MDLIRNSSPVSHLHCHSPSITFTLQQLPNVKMSVPSKSFTPPTGQYLHSPPASAPSSPPSTYITYPTLPQWSDPRYVYSYTLHSELVKPTPSESGGPFGLSDISRANCGARDAAYRSAETTPTMSSVKNSGPIGYDAADDMSSRLKRYYRNGFPKVEEGGPAAPSMTTGLIAAGLRFEANAPVSEPTSSSEAAKVERYYRSRVTRGPAIPAKSGSEAGGLPLLNPQTELVSESAQASTSSSGSTSTSHSPLTSRSTSPTPSQQSAGEKQLEMMEDMSDEKACVIY